MAPLIGMFKRGRIWHYRVRVPVDIRWVIGKAELTKSLKTNDYNEAVQRYRIVCSNVQCFFTKARSGALKEKYEPKKLLHNCVTHQADFRKSIPSDSQTNVTAPVQNYGDVDVIVEKVVERVLSSLGHHITKREPMTITELFNRYMADP